MDQNREAKSNEAARQGKGRILLLILVLAAVAVFIGIDLLSAAEDGEAPGTIPMGEAEEGEVQQEPIALSIVCVGDIMVHRSQIPSQYDAETDTYDYTDNFRFIKPYITGADVAMANVETTFAGGTPTGYPSFNAPDSLADAIANAGFTVGITSNNHLYDKGLDGLKRTIGILRIAGLATAGTRLPEEKRYTLLDIKGVNVAIIAYTYETPSQDELTRINGVPLSSDVADLINSFSHERLDKDMEEIGSVISTAREDGADIVVVYYHFGEEYQETPNIWQRDIAQRTADLGADILFASHPHVLQSAEWIEGLETGRRIPVFFSLGNFLSNQRTETLANRFTEQGMIAKVDIQFDLSKGEITEMKMSATGTWLDKYKIAGKDRYAIIPLDEYLEENEAIQASGHLARAQQAYNDIREILGNIVK